MIQKAVVTGSFDNLNSAGIRLLDEAAKLGDLHVYLWADALIQTWQGEPPQFPQAERLYLLQGLRYVKRVEIVEQLPDRDALPAIAGPEPIIWVMREEDCNERRRTFCAAHGLTCQAISPTALNTFPPQPAERDEEPSFRPKAIATGCFDWFHSGHMRFFEEASAWGDLYVVVGSDRNVRLLKGEGHPLFSEDERRYLVGSVRFVKQALISSGSGWMDAEPEIDRIKPEMYVVNEDGDKPEKRAFCESHGIRYVVLKREPKDGLPRRQSTDLRGF